MTRCSTTPTATRPAATARLLMLLSLALALLFAAPSASAAVIYVNAAATGEPQDGHSWATAFRTIRAAVDIVTPEDEIWVAAGQYGPTQVTRTAALYGGFAGTETAREQRDFKRHPSEVDGGSEPALAVGSGSIIDGFVFHSVYQTVILSGGAIRNNIFTRSRVGIRTSGSGSPEISGNTFLMNDVGVYSGNSARLTDNTFIGNNTGVRSYGPFNATAPLTLLRNRFLYGGVGVDLDWTKFDSYPYEVIGNVFLGNTTSLRFFGAVRVINNTFLQNGVALQPRYRILTSYTYGFVQNNIIARNVVGINGTISSLRNVYPPPPNIVQNCFYGNQTDTVGDFLMEGNLYADPKIARDAEARVHIQPDSPCRDAGKVNVYSTYAVLDEWLDLDGQGRIQGTTVDIGADESDGTAWPAVPEPRVVHVRPEGNDGEDGFTWATARRTVPMGIAQAALQTGEVWVAAGDYRGNQGFLHNVPLYGGFTGTETRRDEREPSRNESRFLLMDVKVPILTTMPSPMTGGILDGFVVQGGGTGLRVESPGFTVRRCRFITNETAVEARYATIVDACDFRGNAVAVLCIGPRTAAISDQTRVTNSVFAGNGLGVRAVNGGAPALTGNTFLMNTAGVSVNDTVSAVIANSLFVKNDVGVERIGNTATVTARNNNTWGNGTGWANLPDPTGHDGNIALDPKLVSDSLGDVHLLPGSPCIDAGDGAAVANGAIDIDGQARVQGAGVDIGSDEADGAVRTATPRIVRVSPAGDDASDGASWTDAMKSLGAALDAAAGAGGEVWLADGTYRENARLRPFVAILGGFRGSETSASQRKATRDGTAFEPADAEAATLTAMTGMAPVTLDGLTLRNGGVGLFCDASAPTVTNDFFHDNRTAIHAFFRSHPVITGNSLEANDDGVVLDDASRATVRNNVIKGNEIGVYAYDAGPVVAGNLIIEGGTGMEVTWKAAPTVVNNTIARNETGVTLKNWGKPLVANSIIALNATGIRSTGIGNAPTLRQNLVGANAADYAGLADPTGTDGNVMADPLFLDAAAGNYRLWRTSPGIDAGDNTYFALAGVDLEGSTRTWGARMDLGAYEFRGIVADERARAVAALRIVGGLVPAITDDLAMLDEDADGAITTHDAIRWIRKYLMP